jgi:hypothetical protein
MFRIGMLIIASVAISSLTEAQRIQPLDSADFNVAGISGNLDTSAVINRLGMPTTRKSEINPFDSPSRLHIWKYPGLSVHFASDYTVFGITVDSPRYPTKRGLKAGDSVLRLRRLYGEPSEVDENESAYAGPVNVRDVDWDYQDPAHEMHVIRVTLRNNKVRSIYLGALLD